MTHKWYYARGDGHSAGPIDEEQFLKRVREGVIDASFLIRSPTRTGPNWVEAYSNSIWQQARSDGAFDRLATDYRQKTSQMANRGDSGHGPSHSDGIHKPTASRQTSD